MDKLKDVEEFFEGDKILQKSFQLNSRFLGRIIEHTVFIPNSAGPFPLLIVNDGQEHENLELHHHLEQTLFQRQIWTPLTIAIHAKDRLSEFGTIGYPDFKGRGALAHSYFQYLKYELLPYLYLQYPLLEQPSRRAVAGFSLSGLHALHSSLFQPEEKLFGTVGVFSGSFWWRSKGYGEGYTEEDRIMHKWVKGTPSDWHPRMFFQTGTLDEFEDRNGNGIIDSIEDTLDLMEEWELRYRYSDLDLKYVEVQGGRHDHETWSSVFPEFLKWAFSL